MGPALNVPLREMSVLYKTQIKGVRKAGTNARRPFYRGVRLLEISVKTESFITLKSKTVYTPVSFPFYRSIELRKSTGSEPFSLLICLDAIKFVLLKVSLLL